MPSPNLTEAGRRGLNLFYEEPEDDRWLPFDRYPRRIVRRLVRGARQPGGQQRVFLNLCAGLDRIGLAYRVNDYRWSRSHPEQLACIIGKPNVLDRMAWQNPILFGAAVHSHPLADPTLLQRLPIRKVLVPGPWMKRMCEPYWGEAVEAWPVGIDTDLWRPSAGSVKEFDVLLYDKVRWDHERFEGELIGPIRDSFTAQGLTVAEIRYGHYREEEFRALLARSRSMVFLCEHETQGIAYQQALAAGVPILAWDRGGPWQDPEYFPDRVVFGPVTSVPYWDERCGLRFEGIDEFREVWGEFWEACLGGRLQPRDYIIENLTLEICARRYLDLAHGVEGS